ncbi:MAG TPA: glycoside hydrolase family 88 protein [Steroidobacteraceae bacterium]|nr:glycoside hydrolase family 88 protein [Steroidobacteraceae bacterium]
MNADIPRARLRLNADHVNAVCKEPLQRADELNRAPSPDVVLIRDGIAFAIAKIDQNLLRFGDRFPTPSSVRGSYGVIGNIEWTNGFWTGMLWLAYEMTGDARYRRTAESHVASFLQRARERAHLDHHDLGFLYTLSCVSSYKLTGSSIAREAALEAARLLLRRYLPAAGIIQAWGDLSDPAQRGRMIIDCNLNLPLLYWATEMTDDACFANAADRHLEHAAMHLVRADGSTFHTFQMDAETGAPLGGKTHQGRSDSSCWARGQAWGIYGFPLGFRYLRNPQLLRISKRLANYFLNRLPDDHVCYWDLDFTSGDQPRDSSAAAIAACGLLELAGLLPRADTERHQYEAAAGVIVGGLVSRYRTARESSESGLLRHAVYHLPNNVGVDESCIWGDYFYFEALVRLSRPWTSYW